MFSLHLVRVPNCSKWPLSESSVVLNERDLTNSSVGPSAATSGFSSSFTAFEFALDLFSTGVSAFLALELALERV